MTQCINYISSCQTDKFQIFKFLTPKELLLKIKISYIKKTVLFLVVIISLFACTKEDDIQIETIYEGDIILTSQKAVDSLGFFNYTQIIGKLYIGGTFSDRNISIKNIDKLGTLKAVNELHVVYNNELSNIDGLSNLTLVDDLKISYNMSLTNIDGLKSLASLNDGKIEILANTSLVSLYGLSNLEYIGDLSIIGNAIANLNGLNNLTSAGILYVDNNEHLTDLLGLNSLDKVNYLHIYGNDLLLNLEGLNNLSMVGERGLWIRQNFALNNLSGLEKLSRIKGNLSIFENYDLKSLLGLDNLISIEGNLSIAYNTLESLEGLTNFCSLQTLINTNGIVGDYNIWDNVYNPSQEDIRNGDCSQ